MALPEDPVWTAVGATVELPIMLPVAGMVIFAPDMVMFIVGVKLTVLWVVVALPRVMVAIEVQGV